MTAACIWLAGIGSAAAVERNYLVHEPVGWPDWWYPPVVVVCHGLGDTYTNFAGILPDTGWVDASDTYGFILIVPDHGNTSRPSFLSLKSNGSFDGPATQQRSNEIMAMVRDQVRANRDIDLGRIFFLGFSEGATFSDLSQLWHLESVAGSMLYAGGVAGKGLGTLPRTPPIWVAAGTDDPLTPSVTAAAQEWSAAGCDVRGGFPEGVGHSFRTLCNRPEGDPDNSARIILGLADRHPTVAIGRPDEVVRRITIRHDRDLDDPTVWECRPGPWAWPIAGDDHAARFTGLYSDGDHLIRIAPPVAPAAVEAQAEEPVFVHVEARPDGPG